MTKTCLMLLILCFGSALLLAASPAVGSWECKGEGEREFAFTLTFVEEDGVLSGTMTSPRGERTLSDVKCEDGVVTAKMESERFSMTFRAEIDGDRLKGTMSNERFDMPFSGTRK